MNKTWIPIGKETQYSKRKKKKTLSLFSKLYTNHLMFNGFSIGMFKGQTSVVQCYVVEITYG
jgi:hypothetical protein